MESEIIDRCWAKINLDSLLSNAKWIINNKSSNEKIMAIVKANAYGCGASMVAKTLYSDLKIDNWAVASIYEAEKLRNDNIKGNILILGFTPISQVEKLVKLNVTQTILNEQYANLLNEKAASLGLKVKVQIALDTGMNRIGFLKGEDHYKVFKMPNLEVCGAYTHLSHADSFKSDAVEYTKNQIDDFIKRTKNIKNLHCQNSAAIITKAAKGFDYIRPGIILYGLKPSEEVYCDELKEVLSFKSVVAMIKEVKKGAEIGYGRTYKALKDTKIATIPIGYADGYPRLLSNKGEVLIKGKRCKIIGNVCMDQIMVDVTDVDCKMGDIVTIIGDDGNESIKADDLAKKIGTIGYEIICNISQRVPRVYYKDNKLIEVKYL